jgi:hypothetical protein
MTALRPFFTLIGRASVFWLGLFTLVWLTIVVVGLGQPEARVAQYLDAVLVGSLGFPCAAGWLFGLVVQEFAHTSFAGQLPGVRRRIAAGYLAMGALVTLMTVFFVAQSEPRPFGPWLMIVLGFGAYCAGGVLLDPLSKWVTAVNAAVVLLIAARSRAIAEQAGDHPWIAGALALTVGAAGLWRLFARRTFRLKPFRLTNPLPGRFSVERTAENERRRIISDHSKKVGWRSGYLGVGSWAWLRAAHHEVHGGLGWKAFARALSKMWGLLLIVLVSAWIDKGDMSFLRALGYSLYDAMFRSPHVEPFGKAGGPYLMVMIIVAISGFMTALSKPIALGDRLLYPLSREQRARVSFHGGLADAAILFLVLGAGLFAIGHVVGLLVGFEPHFDYMPYYLRALLVTLVLMPLAHWGRFRLQIARREKAELTIIGIVFGGAGFVIAVVVGLWFTAVLFASPLAEFAVMAAAFAFTHLIYRKKLQDYYRTADLA